MDSATQSLKRPSVARIQVEIDLLKKLPSRVWIGTGDNQGFWQKVEADEDLPSYCSHCWHVGHSETVCTVKHPELKTRIHATHKAPSAGPSVGQIYRPVANLESRPSASGLNASEKLLIPSVSASLPSSDVAPEPHHSSEPPSLTAVPEVVVVPPILPSGTAPSSPNSSHAGDTDEEIEVDSPGRAKTLPKPSVQSMTHSDTDEPVHVSTLAEFRTFAGTLSHLVPQPPPDEPWLQPKRRKKYTKRNFGPPNVRTRSSTSLIPVIND